jgi:CheY-like chemotaxis protein
MDQKKSSKVMENIFTRIGLAKEERLMRAARHGNLEKTKNLLKHGCDPNSKTKGGYTALMRAAMNGHLDVAKTLLDAGANPNLHENTEEMTPLHFAANRNYPEVIKILIEYGADTEAKEKNGLYTPLFFAVFSGHTEAVKVLLDGGASPDPEGYEREELVQMSLFLGYDEITSMLLTAGTTEDIDIQPRILIVDDDRSIVSVCRDYFRKQGYETYTALCSEEALELLSKKSIDVVITDVNRPSMSGLELTTIIKEKYDTEVIISTGYPEGCSHEKARKIGAFELFYKPVRLAELLNSVKKALEKRLPTLQDTK